MRVFKKNADTQFSSMILFLETAEKSLLKVDKLKKKFSGIDQPLTIGSTSHHAQ
jgi:hypothetical protein